jgi:hypothetical protein
VAFFFLLSGPRAWWEIRPGTPPSSEKWHELLGLDRGTMGTKRKKRRKRTSGKLRREGEMRMLALTGAVVFLFASAPAFAHGPSGSREENADGTYDNQVQCGKGTRTPAGVIYAGTNGVEACNDRGPLPVQGRTIVTTNSGGYVAVDGDGNNPGITKGWIRVDRSGVRCGDDRGRRDATHPDSRDTRADCG